MAPKPNKFTTINTTTIRILSIEKLTKSKKNLNETTKSSYAQTLRVVVLIVVNFFGFGILARNLPVLF